MEGTLSLLRVYSGAPIAPMEARTVLDHKHILYAIGQQLEGLSLENRDRSIMNDTSKKRCKMLSTTPYRAT